MSLEGQTKFEKHPFAGFPSLPKGPTATELLAHKIREATRKKTLPCKVSMPVSIPVEELPFAEGVSPIFASLLKESFPSEPKGVPRNEIPEDMFDTFIPEIKSLIKNEPEFRKLNEQEDIDLWVDRFADACEAFPEKRNGAILAAAMRSKPEFRDRLIPVIVALQKLETAQQDFSCAEALLEELGNADLAHPRFHQYKERLIQIVLEYQRGQKV